MESIIEFIQNWGYVAVFLGALVEGESIILTASFLAYHGYLDIYKLMLVAFAGTLFADQTLYYVGRWHGDKILKKYPRLQWPASRAFRMLHKWDVGFILVFRFVYGIRTISPIVIGTSGIPPRRFVPLNFLAAVIWTVISCSAGYLGGYLLGDAVEEIVRNFHHYQTYFIIFLIGFITLLVGGVWFGKKYLLSPKPLSNRQIQKDIKELISQTTTVEPQIDPKKDGGDKND